MRQPRVRLVVPNTEVKMPSAPRARQLRFYRSAQPPGMGMIKWWDVMAVLCEINFDGVLSLKLNFPNGFAELIFEQYCRLAFNMANEIANGVKA